MALFNDVHASGYNSAGSERIWMKFRAFRVYCLQLAPADFRRDSRRSKSGRAIRNFVLFCPVNNALFYRFAVSQISQNSHTIRGSVLRWMLSERVFENLPVMVFFPKRSTFAWKSSTTPNLGRDICEMITNRGNSRPIGAPTECWLSICTHGINSVIPLACTARTRRAPCHKKHSSTASCSRVE